jgi:hypothetical protein
MSETYTIYEMQCLPEFIIENGYMFALHVEWVKVPWVINNHLYGEQRRDMTNWLNTQFDGKDNYRFAQQFGERRVFIYFKEREDMLLFKLVFG